MCCCSPRASWALPREIVARRQAVEARNRPQSKWRATVDEDRPLLVRCSPMMPQPATRLNRQSCEATLRGGTRSFAEGYVFDGELVVLDDAGRPLFNDLAARLLGNRLQQDSR
jgi:hypothetical protein